MIVSLWSWCFASRVARLLFMLLSSCFLFSHVGYAKPGAIQLTEGEQQWLQAQHTVRVRVGNWPPFLFTEPQVAGISIDYIKKIFDLHDIQYELFFDKELSWKKALKSIKNHDRVDLLPTIKKLLSVRGLLH